VAHDHHHHPTMANAQSASGRYKGRLAAAFAIVLVFAIVEIVGVVITGSLALLSDAGHMLTDVLGLGLALAAIQLAGSSRAHGPQRSFGVFRLEILAALVNAVLLAGLSIYVLYESVHRFIDPQDIHAGPMLWIAVFGLGANIVAFLLLREGSKESLNLRGAYLEVLADMVSSVGVIIAAVVVLTVGWLHADAVVGAGIGLWVLPRAWRLGREAIRILLQAAPDDVAVDELAEALGALDGVKDAHDIHVWTLTSGMEVATVHLLVAEGTDTDDTLTRAAALCRERYGIEHATIQVETAERHECHSLAW
jgi:cobalt-zinc-cadmium efflux system protein